MKDRGLFFRGKFFGGNDKKGSRRGMIDTAAAPDAAQDVLLDAARCWYALQEARGKAARNERFTFGDQWGDMVYDPVSRKKMSERQHLLEQGVVPLQNNRIRGIVRSVLGVFSSGRTEPLAVARDRDEQRKGELMTTTLQYSYQLNRLWELDRRTLEYYLTSGYVADRVGFGWRNGKMDAWVDPVNYNRLILDNRMEDPRHEDAQLVGMLHDLDVYDVMAQFAGGSRRRAAEIREMYGRAGREGVCAFVETLTEDRFETLDFFTPAGGGGACRVIEVWRKEARERYRVHDTLNGELYKVEVGEAGKLRAENARREADQLAAGVLPGDTRLLEWEWFVDVYWRFYYLTPLGEVLQEGETPFWHGSHPFAFKVYPFYNGRVYPFVSDFIDQNKYINRIITTHELVKMRAAKGLLMVPRSALGDNNEDYFEQRWAIPGRVVVYEAKPGIPAPTQVSSSSVGVGDYEMLQIQLKMLEDISGVHGAMQGVQPNAGTPAALYAQQMQNSVTSLSDILESFNDFRVTRDTKLMQTIQQFYTDKRYVKVAGKENRGVVYDPAMVRDAEFDLSITEGTSTPAYRMVMNDFLMTLFSSGQLSLEELLQAGSFPFADKLLQLVESRKQAMAGGQAAAGPLATPEIMEQVARGMDPRAREMLESITN
jgi:hypothetical protein